MSVVIKNSIGEGLQRLQTFFKKESKQALKGAALSQLEWIINGSRNLNLTPPILTGQLRGSGSAFVGSELVGDTSSNYSNGKPNTSHSAPDNVITIGFDTSYAAYMHETEWTPGKYSSQSGNTGNKFVEKHLIADRGDLLIAYGSLIKKYLGT